MISTFLLFFLPTFLLLPILFFYSWNFTVLLFAFPSAAIYTAAFLIYIYVLSNYEVSLIVPFYNFNVFFLLILSIIFLDETFNFLKLIGIILLFFGTSFLNSFDIFIILLFTNKVKDIIPTFKSRPKEFLIGSGTNAFSYLFLLIALTEMELSIAEPLCMLSVIITIIFSYIFFKEEIRDRLIGGMIMSIGAVLLIIQL